LTALSAAPKAGNYVMAEELVLDEGADGRGDTSQPGFGLSLIDLTQEITQQLRLRQEPTGACRERRSVCTCQRMLESVMATSSSKLIASRFEPPPMPFSYSVSSDPAKRSSCCGRARAGLRHCANGISAEVDGRGVRHLLWARQS
jgi:hypothetical protein